ncbi:MAG: phosphoglycerate mutase family protein [Microthrixaceae bacterium]
MTVYLVRHGSAGTRNPADSRDSDRALDETGRAQAQLLSDWLAQKPISRIVSSPYLRCTQTVAPLGEALGLVIEADDRLAESTDVDEAWKTLSASSDASIGSGRDVVLCSHGDVIPDLVRRLQLRGMRIHGKSGFSKGSVWELDGWDGERFESGSYIVVRP